MTIHRILTYLTLEVSNLVTDIISHPFLLTFLVFLSAGMLLTLVFDNKNHMVIRFDCYLVEIVIYCDVELVFLIIGHTQNACDRLFTRLKRHFHQQNIYTFNLLISTLDDSGLKVICIPSDHRVFFNWDKFLNCFTKLSQLEKYQLIINSNFQIPIQVSWLLDVCIHPLIVLVRILWNQMLCREITIFKTQNQNNFHLRVYQIRNKFPFIPIDSHLFLKDSEMKFVLNCLKLWCV